MSEQRSGDPGVVVVGADPREFGNFLAPQLNHAARAKRSRPTCCGRESFALPAEKRPQFRDIWVHHE